MKKHKPDFSRLKKVLFREGEPDRIPLYELHIDNEIIEAIIQKPISKLNWNKKEERQKYIKWLIEFYYKMGYDYVGIPLGDIFPRDNILQAEDTAELKREKRGWIDEHRGVIETEEDFEKYKWTDVNLFDFSHLEYAAKNLPEGMMIIPLGPGGILENVMWLMGMECFFYSLYENPKLIEKIFNKVGETLFKTFNIVVHFDKIGAISVGDDMGFKTQTMISPELLRKYVFPWHKKICEIAHNYNLPFILHSCGNLEIVMEDLIEDVKIDAKHSFEDAILSVIEAKKKYGKKIAVLGGVDMDKLCRLAEEELRGYIRKIIKECAPSGGYALGSGNTIANYVPLKNYLIMIDEWKKYGNYPIKID